MVKKNYDDMLSRFHLIPERHGQTDGRPDRFAISISRVSMLTRDKNEANFNLPTPYGRTTIHKKLSPSGRREGGGEATP